MAPAGPMMQPPQMPEGPPPSNAPYQRPWYLKKWGATKGPYGFDQMVAMARSRTISRGTPVWRAGLHGWTVAGSVPELAQAFSQGSRTSDDGLRRAATGYASPPVAGAPATGTQGGIPAYEDSGLHLLAGGAALMMMVGCFLPWMQLGVVFVNRGLDNPDGGVVLVLALSAVGVAAYNAFGKRGVYRWPYLVAGGIGTLTALADLAQVHRRAENVAKAMGELSGALGNPQQHDESKFVGFGLYIVLLASAGLLTLGIVALGRKVRLPRAWR